MALYEDHPIYYYDGGLKVLLDHNHDERYYTESEVDTKLGTKANLASPALTGTPTAPTASSGTNTTQIATTAFVTSAVSSSANGKVSKTGDTMTGILAINREAGNYGITTKLTNYGLNSLPSSSSAAIDPLVNYEKDMNRIGLIRNTLQTDGTVDYMLGATRPVNGSTVWNTLTFRIGSNGGKTILLEASAWRTALGITDTGWVSITHANVASGTFKYRKCGQMATVRMDGVKLTSALPAKSLVVIGTLPSGVRPDQLHFFPAGDRDRWGFIKISSSGEITFQNDSTEVTTSMSIYGTATFIVGF